MSLENKKDTALSNFKPLPLMETECFKADYVKKDLPHLSDCDRNNLFNLFVQSNDKSA